MQLAAAVALIVAVVLMGGVFASVAEAAIIRASGTFDVHLRGDEDFGDVFDPPLVGSGSFEIRSRPYDPDDTNFVYDFELLDFDYSLYGFTWDESDITASDFEFDVGGGPRDIHLSFDNGVARGGLSWVYEDGAFGMNLSAPNLDSSGSSDGGTAGSEIDVSSVVLPEPGSFGLLGLGLVGLGFGRRRRA